MVQATLIACKGARRVTRGDLAAMPPPRPLGRCHSPVAHHDLVAAVEGNLEAAGYVVRESQYAVQRADNQLFAVFTLASPLTSQDVLAVGLRSSHDQTLNLGLVAGVKTLVCSNLQFRSDLIDVRKKHTSGNVRNGVFHAEVRAALGKLAGFAEVEAARLERMAQTELTQDAAYALVVRAVRTGVMNGRYVEAVAEEFDEPSHDYGKLGALPSSYRLMQAFTTALKPVAERNPARYAVQTQRINKLLTLPFVPEPLPAALAA